MAGPIALVTVPPPSVAAAPFAGPPPPHAAGSRSAAAAEIAARLRFNVGLPVRRVEDQTPRGADRFPHAPLDSAGVTCPAEDVP